MTDAWLGRTLSHYEIVEKLGEGGMGVVYKARDIRLERFVAIKLMPAEKLADADRTRRFIQEAKAASALNHPSIITIYEIAEESGIDFMVMEYVPGKTLDHVIPRQGLRINDALKYAVQIADALATAHEAGIIHRDLKPGNVMVTEKGQVKVLDFGLAKLAEKFAPEAAATQTLQRSHAPLTEEGTMLGTVAYMSPEQAEAKEVDARSDIFSFGSLLYEMLTGRRAFAGDSRLSTLTAILRDEPKLQTQSGDSIPRDLEKIITRCLRKDRTRRFQTMADLKLSLEEVKEESESGRLQNLAAQPAHRRSPLIFAVVGAVVLVIGAALWWRSHPPASGTLGSAPSLRQLTQANGRTTDPAISPNGELIAYSSDRGGDGGMDIWVQQLTAGAQPIRLTRNKADDIEPSFSPDGARIGFSSGRDGGGIYVIPALGGEERLLLRGPYHGPRFSPDSRWMAAWTSVSQNARIVIAPVAGGATRTIAPDFYFAGAPVWSPDGTRILFAGQRQQGDPIDLWVAPLDSGSPVSLGAATVHAKIPGTWRLGEWLDDQILFSAGNLWRIPLSRDLKLGAPERLTMSSADESLPRAIKGPKGWRVVFVSSQSSQSLWSLPIDLNSAKPKGEPVKLFEDGLERSTPSLSADGSRMSYVYHSLDGYGVRVRDMKTGSETTVVQASPNVRARISLDGSTVAYSQSAFTDEKQRVIYMVSAAGGEARKFCENCGLLYDWSPDGKKILYRSGNPMRFSMIEVATGRRTEIVSNPRFGIYDAILSADQRWLAIKYGGVDAPRELFIARTGADCVVKPQNEWIIVAENPGGGTRPWWSPDGNVLYYESAAEGHLSIWARHLEPQTKQPRGAAFGVYTPPAQWALAGGHPFGPALGSRQLIFPIAETTSNIWLVE